MTWRSAPRCGSTTKAVPGRGIPSLHAHHATDLGLSAIEDGGPSGLIEVSELHGVMIPQVRRPARPPCRGSRGYQETGRPVILMSKTRRTVEANPDIPVGLTELVADRRAAGPALLPQIRQKHPHISSQWSRDWSPKQGRPPSRRERVRSVDRCFSMLVHTFTRWGTPLPAGYRTASSRSRGRPGRRSRWHHPRTIRRPPRKAGRARQGAADEIPWCPQCRPAGW